MELPSGADALIVGTFGDVTVTEIQTLVGSQRTRVCRVRFTDAEGAPDSVIVKAFVGTDHNAIREPATLRLLTANGVPGSPRLIAESPGDRVILMTDEGTHPTLAQRLLGKDPAAAESALLRWARTLGRLHAASTGLRAELARELARGDIPEPPAVDEMPGVVAASPAQIKPLLATLGVVWTEEATAELLGISTLLDVSMPGSAGAVSPADTCPDNNIDGPDGLVLLDFEGGQFRHVAWDTAYLTVPWPSCWCSWALPSDLADAAYSVWQEEAAHGIPAVLTADFEVARMGARVAWAFVTLGWFMGSVLDRDAPVHPERPDTPSRRALMEHRMASAAACEAFPELQRMAVEALTGMRVAWGDLHLDVNPAFR